MMRQVRRADTEEQAVLSQKLIEAALGGDELLVEELLSTALVDVNHMGPVNLSTAHIDIIQHEEAPDELKTGYVQFKTDITALFAAAHSGYLDVVRKLLLAGADVNQKLFRGYAMTAAVREGHCDVVSLLLKSGVRQAACEEAFLEACLYGQVKAAELLISWEKPRPEVISTALIHACGRGFLDVLKLLTKNGIDVNLSHRVLLCSLKPALHLSVNCSALVAAIVCRQAHVVKYLLEAGARTDSQARLGAWSWDCSSEEVVRVGAGMGEPYEAVWCAIEYWESTGAILSMLLEHVSSNTTSLGRSLLCHAILCGNDAAARILLSKGANVEYTVCTEDGAEFRALHLAAKKGVLPSLKTLVTHGCDLDARTGMGETALMLCAMYGHQDCFRELILAGADLGAVNKAGQTAVEVGGATIHETLVGETIRNAILSGDKLYSSNPQNFSPIHFVAHHGDAQVMQKLLEQKDVDVNQQDKLGFSALMVAAQAGQIEVFRVLVFSGAHIGLKNVKGETALTLGEGSGYREQCERVLLDAILANILKGADFKSIHFAAKRGNCEALMHLLKQGSSVNSLDSEGYTPLMICTREGHADACKLLLNQGADCYYVNSRGETALALAKRNPTNKVVEEVMIDHIARKVVLAGGQLSKHTRQGKGAPHPKNVKLLTSGILSWGETRRRNIPCKEASLGSSIVFRENRRNHDGEKAGIFRVVAMDGKEVHFDAAASFTAELWVRGINLIVKENIQCN